MLLNLYKVIKTMLLHDPKLRSNDHALLWEFWKLDGTVKGNYISRESFLKATPSETVTRVRRKLQETDPTLGATLYMKNKRKSIADQKGTHIYREVVEVNNETNTVVIKHLRK